LHYTQLAFFPRTSSTPSKTFSYRSCRRVCGTMFLAWLFSRSSFGGRCIVHRSSIGHSLAASPDPATQGMTRSVRRRSNHLPATPATFCTSGRSREGAYRCRRFRTSRRTCRLVGLSNSSLIAGARASISPARPASATAYPAIRGLHRGDSWLYRSHALRDLDSQINQAPRSPVASRFGEA
jgi:hypothetical protein